MGKIYLEKKSQKRPNWKGSDAKRRGPLPKNSDQVKIKDNEKNSVNGFKVLFTNSGTLLQYKLQELELRIEDRNPSIIAISDLKTIFQTYIQHRGIWNIIYTYK